MGLGYQSISRLRQEPVFQHVSVTPPVPAGSTDIRATSDLVNEQQGTWRQPVLVLVERFDFRRF